MRVVNTRDTKHILNANCDDVAPIVRSFRQMMHNSQEQNHIVFEDKQETRLVQHACVKKDRRPRAVPYGGMVDAQNTTKVCAHRETYSQRYGHPRILLPCRTISKCMRPKTLPEKTTGCMFFVCAFRVKEKSVEQHSIRQVEREKSDGCNSK